jgi:hypothetical protein
MSLNVVFNKVYVLVVKSTSKILKFKYPQTP